MAVMSGTVALTLETKPGLPGGWSSSGGRRHRHLQEVFWLEKFRRPGWGEFQVAGLDRDMSHDRDFLRCAGFEKGVAAETVKELCHDGQLREAVEGLGVLVRTEGFVSRALFYAVLKTCLMKKDLVLGRRVHAFTVRLGYQSDTFLGNHIVRMYAVHGRLQEVMDVFERVAKPDAFTWSAIISAHVKHGAEKQAMELYRRMRRSSAKPDGHVIVAALQACAKGLDLESGQQVHADVSVFGVESDLFVCNGLVNMYAKCGSLKDAQRLFDGLVQKDVVTWTALIAGYSQQGMGQEALRLYSVMQEEGMAVPNSVTFVCLLQACASVGNPALAMGKQLHAQVRQQGHETNVFVASSLVNMFAKCGSLEDAQRVFDRLSQKEVVTWTALIAGYSQQGMGYEALRLYGEMQTEGITVPNSVTFVSLLQACANVGTPAALETGKQLHTQVRQYGHETDVFVASSLVNMYAKCGCLEDARKVFDALGQKDDVTWTALIAGYSQRGMGQEALSLYAVMRESGMAVPNSVTFVCLLQACASLGAQALEMAKQLHVEIRERGHEADVVVGNSLVNMYVKCGSLQDAQRVFDGLCRRDVVTWNVMIAGYSQRGMGQEALRLFRVMQVAGNAVPDSVTFVSLLQACADVGATALETGKELHVQITGHAHQTDAFIANSLVNMYAKCGSLKDARRLFDGLGQKDVVTWTALIAGYSQQGMGQEALALYKAMQQEGIAIPNSMTFSCLLQACASVGNPALAMGKQLHAQVREGGYQSNVFVASSLVNMYAKCGSVEDAQRVFDRLGEKDLVTWTALIAGYSQQAMGLEALRLYNDMQEEGITVHNPVTFVCLLQACASVGTLALEKGKQLHTQIIEAGHQANMFVASSLVNMYSKCGSLEDAQRVFAELGQKDVVTWNAMLAGYSQQGMAQEAFHLFNAMLEDSMVVPNSVTFVCLLQACAIVGRPALEIGKHLHVQIGELEHQADVFVVGSLVNMYAKCGSLEDARKVFDGLAHKDVVTWNAIIAGYSQLGMGQDALCLYDTMQEEKMAQPDAVTYVSLLQACACLGSLALEKGKQLHEQIRERGYQACVFVASSLVNMYAKCGSLEDAQIVFDGLGQKDVVTWNALIAGYSQRGMGKEALFLYDAMQEEGIAAPDAVTFVSLLQACACVGSQALEKGKQLHTQISDGGHQADGFVANSLVNMYAKCGSLVDAQRVFDGLGQKDVVTWNALITGYSQHGKGQEALHLHTVMQKQGIALPDSVTFVALLQACASVGSPALETGKQLHAQIGQRGHQSDLFVVNSLLNMYAKCDGFEDAQKVFEGLGRKDVVTWNTIIAGYSQRGMWVEAFSAYSDMQEEDVNVPDSVTFVCLLGACASVGGSQALEKGRQLHMQLRERGHQADGFVASSLVNMYAKCGSLGDAQRVFDGLGEKDVVTWNAMIAGYARQGKGQEALRLHAAMEQEGITVLDSVTFVCLLQACASMGTLALEKGKQLHAQIREQGQQAEVLLANSLVNMYAKCGSLEDAQSLFDGLGQKDVVTWNAMIAGYSQQGMGQEALRLYIAMDEEGISVPDSVTYVCLLQACANVAALHLGRHLHAQIQEQGLEADLFVAGSLINMYGKSGSMLDAELVFNALPEKDVVTWNALIAGYTSQGDSEVVFNLVQRMEQEGLQPVGITFLSVLTVCSHAGLVSKGREYFESMSRDYGITPTVLHLTCMVDLLGRAGLLDEALALVRSLPVVPDAAVWLTLLGACQKWGNVEVANHAFNQAVKLDKKDASAYVLMSNIYTGAHMWEQAHVMQASRVSSKAWKDPGQSWWTDDDGMVHSFLTGAKNHTRSPISLNLQVSQGEATFVGTPPPNLSANGMAFQLCRRSKKLAIPVHTNLHNQCYNCSGGCSLSTCQATENGVGIR